MSKGWLVQIAKRVKRDEGMLLRPLIDAHLVARNRVKDSVDNWVHPSSLGDVNNLCAREIYLAKFTPIEKYPLSLLVQDHTAKTYRIFDHGNLTHLRYQWYMISMGLMDPRKHVGWEVPVEDKDLLLRGHTDGIIYPYTEVRKTPPIEMVPDGHGGHAYPSFNPTGLSLPKTFKFSATGRRSVLEIKSIRHSAFATLHEPQPHHQMQAMAYMACLSIEECFFIYESKDTQEVKEYKFPMDWKKWGVARTVLRDVKLKRDKNKLPDRICSKRTDDRACKCAMADICFSTRTHSELVNIKGSGNAIKSPK